MKPIVVTRTIDAPIEEVFALFSDIPNCADHIQAIEKVEMLSDGPVGLGTRWRETRIMFKKEATEEMWITEWNPPNGYAVEAESCGTHYRTDIQLVPEGDRTRVSYSFGGRPVSLMSKVMSPMFFFMAGMVRKCFAKDIDDLQAILESKPVANA